MSSLVVVTQFPAVALLGNSRSRLNSVRRPWMAILNPLERAAIASLRLAPSRRQTIALEMPPTPTTYGSINGPLPTTDDTPMTRPQRGARYITADGRPVEPEGQYQYVQSATDDGYFDIELEAGGDYYAMELIPSEYQSKSSKIHSLISCSIIQAAHMDVLPCTHFLDDFYYGSHRITQYLARA